MKEILEEQRTPTEVWDWQTRVLHWVNALLIIALALIMIGAESMKDLGVDRALRRPVKELHAYLGHFFIITLTLRLIWGFIGNKYAKWSDMIPFGAEGRKGIAHNIKWYLSGFKGRAAHAIGHDPLASIFYIVLFIVLISQAVTGVVLSGAEFHMFPGTLLTAGMSKDSVEALHESLEELHEAGYFFLLFFLAAHLIGLVVHEVKERTGLFSSMISGCKYLRRD